MAEQLPGRRSRAAPASLSALADRLRPYRAIIFDWDGTAVVSRREDTAALATLAEALLRHGVRLIVVAGTNVGHIERQLAQLLTPAARQRLIACMNRGSEVYGFDAWGAAVRRSLRVATAGEELALTAIAEALRDTIQARTGLEVGIVYDRLNRRKIDLIPLPAWADPPKARIGALLDAVEARLRGAGLSGGLAEAIHLTERLAREHGLPQARITSDVKHIEVGLTDKRDALDWLKREFLRPKGIPLDDVLIAGDEFGPIAGFSGSDDLLRAGAGAATVVSVGSEPNGVPEGVLHLGGGPTRFRALLAEQVWLHRRQPSQEARGGRVNVMVKQHASRGDWADTAFAPPSDPAWRLEEQGYQPALEHEVETRFAVGNGLLGVRGSLEQPTIASRPRTFVAGLFDTPPGEPSVPALIPGPDWLRLRVLVDGEPVSLDTGETLAHARALDLRRGAFIADWRRRDPAGRTVRLRALRLASLADRAVAVQVAQVEVDRPVALTLEAWLEPPGEDLFPERTGPGLSVWRTAHSGRLLGVASAATLRAGGGLSRHAGTDGTGRLRWSWVATPGLTRARRHRLRSGAPAVPACAACSQHTRTPGQSAGRRAMSWSRATRRRNGRCASPSTTW